MATNFSLVRWMQKNHAEVAIVDEPQLDIIFSSDNLQSDFLLKYAKASPFFVNPLFAVFNQKSISKSNLLSVFTRDIGDTGLFF